MHTVNVLCPTCHRPAIRHADENLKFTGKWCCVHFLTCPQMAFYHIPSAHEVEATGRRLAPLHEANLDMGAI